MGYTVRFYDSEEKEHLKKLIVRTINLNFVINEELSAAS
jgi:hypothetical protein